MSEKPVIFISHSSKDGDIAEILSRQLIISLNLQSDEVFVSSTPDGIKIGERWFDTVIRNLDESDALIVLVTPNSIDSNWVWFEFGYYWSKAKENVYPIYVPQITHIPSPLNELQAKSISEKTEFLAFINTLRRQFNIQPRENIEFFDEIIETLAATNFSVFEYSEKYILNKLKEFVENQLESHKDYQRNVVQPWGGPKFKNNIFTGTIINYSELDIKLNLPKGASQKYLKDATGFYGLEAIEEDNVSIQFRNIRKRNL